MPMVPLTNPYAKPYSPCPCDGPTDHAHMWFWSHLTRPKCGVSVCVGLSHVSQCDEHVSVYTYYSSVNSMFASKTYKLHSTESVWECVCVRDWPPLITIVTFWSHLSRVCVCVYVITINSSKRTQYITIHTQTYICTYMYVHHNITHCV